MIRSTLSIVLSLCASAALATGKPPATPPGDSFDVRSSSSSSASAAAAAAATGIGSGYGYGAGGAGGMGGSGGAASSSMQDSSRSTFYVLPSPAAAAPLPGTICPKGDSQSVSLVWGFVSWSTSSTRTELECLEKWAAVLRASEPQPMRLPMLLPGEPMHPPVAPAAVEREKSVAPAAGTVIRPPRRAKADVRPAQRPCGAGEVLACVRPKT